MKFCKIYKLTLLAMLGIGSYSNAVTPTMLQNVPTPQSVSAGVAPAVSTPITGPSSMNNPSLQRQGKDARVGNPAIKDMRKKLFELKKFELEAIRQNLKDLKAFSDSINKKISDLGLSTGAFDALRALPDLKEMERAAINKLENGFLEFKRELDRFVKGFPKFEEMEAQAAAQQQQTQTAPN